MFENLKLRWALILGALFFGIYFSFPTFQYFTTSEKNTDKISSLKVKAINLGLDLRGGLHIVLELDERKFLEKLIRSKLSQKSKDSYKDLLDKAELMAIKNNTNIIIQLNKVASDSGIKLNKYFSNLSKSSDNSILIEQIKDQKSLAMSSILEIMRNRIQEHDVYGLGEPSIQNLGENRLMVELAGIDDVSRATIKIIERGINQETYHIAGDKLISIKDLVKTLCIKMNYNYKKLVLSTPERIGKDKYYKLSNKKIKNNFKWKEEISLDNGLESCITWMKDNINSFNKTDENYLHKK